MAMYIGIIDFIVNKFCVMFVIMLQNGGKPAMRHPLQRPALNRPTAIFARAISAKLPDTAGAHGHRMAAERTPAPASVKGAMRLRRKTAPAVRQPARLRPYARFAIANTVHSTGTPTTGAHGYRMATERTPAPARTIPATPKRRTAPAVRRPACHRPIVMSAIVLTAIPTRTPTTSSITKPKRRPALKKAGRPMILVNVRAATTRRTRKFLPWSTKS